MSKSIKSTFCILSVVLYSLTASGACNKPDGSPYVAVSVAIAGHGADGGNDDGAEDSRATKTGFNWYSVNTGDELISRLKTVCGASGTISELTTFTHGYWRGLILSDDAGFYYESYGLPAAATLADLQTAMTENRIRFCNPIIKIQACNVGDNSFGQMLSSMTQGTVYVATGLSSPYIVNDQETGWFYSSGSPWKKYVNGVEVENPHLTDDDLSTPNQYGTNKLKCW